MLRRSFLTALAAAPVASLAAARIDASRLAVLTDEVAKSPAAALAFVKQYGVRWLELRNVPGSPVHYGLMPGEDAKAAAKEFSENGLKVSFVNTPFFKIALPGTEPARRTPEAPEAREKRVAREKDEFDKRFDQLERAMRNARLYGADKLRVFGFRRVDKPETTFEQSANVIGEFADRAGKEGFKLLVENEATCNVASSSELAAFIKLMPKNVGINWDPMNAATYETPYPAGYQLLPKKLIWNVQVKGKTLLEPSDKLDWAAIFASLAKDGYSGKVGLETHYGGSTNVDRSHESTKEVLRILGS